MNKYIFGLNKYFFTVLIIFFVFFIIIQASVKYEIFDIDKNYTLEDEEKDKVEKFYKEFKEKFFKKIKNTFSKMIRFISTKIPVACYKNAKEDSISWFLKRADHLDKDTQKNLKAMLELYLSDKKLRSLSKLKESEQHLFPSYRRIKILAKILTDSIAREKKVKILLLKYTIKMNSNEEKEIFDVCEKFLNDKFNKKYVLLAADKQHRYSFFGDG